MDSSYVNVMETSELAYLLVVYAIHAAVAIAQAFLACFLLVTGAGEILWPRQPASRRWGCVRVVLAAVLVAPLAVRVPYLVSLLAVASALVLLMAAGRRSPEVTRSRRAVRGVAVVCAGVATLFMLWEREDNLALGWHLLASTNEFRNEELAWQHSNDPQSPKVGEPAPDFELQDPEGKERVRLSDYRGKRPVALIFGSHT